MNLARPLRFSKRSRRVLFALGACAVLADVGCSQEQGNTRSIDSIGRDSAAVMRTLHLLGSGSGASEIVYSQVDQLVAGDAASASCGSTGIFVLAGDGASSRLERPWFTCGFVWELDVGVLDPAGDVLAYVSKMSPTTLRLINLETGSVGAVSTACQGLIEGMAWNRGGTLLALVERCNADDAHSGSLELVHVDGSRAEEVLARGVHGSPSWFASDELVAVANTVVDDQSRIVIFDRHGRQLSSIENARNPAALPASEAIAFTRRVKDSVRVYRAELASNSQPPSSVADGIPSCPRDNDTAGAHSPIEMHWSRDGRVLAVRSGSCIWRAVSDDGFGRWIRVIGR